jgi:hypothetical protein
MTRNSKRPRKSDGEEYRFKIEAYTPATIPMLRLAEYMQHLALLLGETAHVHFRRVAPGSTILVHSVEREAAPKVRARVASVQHGDGPPDAVRAYQATNKLLRDDNAVGHLRNGRIRLSFPGREEPREEFTSVRQQGFIDGVITGVRGRDESIHITLQVEDKQVSGCHTNRAIAKQLAARFFEPVRLFGKGKWHRDSDGNWELEDFKVESFEPLDDAPLSKALAVLRAVPTQWDDNAYRELDVIRHGPRGKRNGGL